MIGVIALLLALVLSGCAHNYVVEREYMGVVYQCTYRQARFPSANSRLVCCTPVSEFFETDCREQEYTYEEDCR